MADRMNPIAPPAALTSQLRRKSRRRRHQLERMAVASTAFAAQ